MIAGNPRSSVKRKGDNGSYGLSCAYMYSSPAMKVMKRSSGSKLNISGTLKRDVSLAQGGSYFASEKDFLDKEFVSPVETSVADESGRYINVESDVNSAIHGRSQSIGRVLDESKDDLTLCSIKGGDQVRISINNDLSFAVPPVDLSTHSAATNASTDPLDHSYPKDNESDSEIVDPVRNTWVTTKADKAQLRNSGHSWKTGKWSENEVELLKRNIDKYCAEHGIEDVRQIIYNASKEERPKFYPTISIGLDRPVFSVYRRVKRMYDSQNYRGKYSADEVEKLKDLHAKYGHEWTVIGQEMGRSSDSVKDRCRLVRGAVHNPGKWSEEEEMKLSQAVYDITGVQEGTPVTSNINWSVVAEKVATRTVKQCRTKWLNYLNWKKCDGEKWTKTEDAVLLQRIVASGADSEDSINWKKISDGWKSSRSPQWLRIKWWSLKQFYLGKFLDASGMSFKDLVVELAKLIRREISSWDRSRRSRKPLMNLDSRPEKKPKDIGTDSIPKKLPKITSAATSNVVSSSSSNKQGSIPLLYIDNEPDSGIPREMPQDVFYVMDQDGKVQGQIMLDKESSENAFMTTIDQESNTEHENGTVDTNAQIGDDQHQISVVDTSDGAVEMDTTLHLAPTNTPGVFLVQNSDCNNPLMFVLSDDVNSVDFAPESYINNASSSTVATSSSNDVTDNVTDTHDSADDTMTSSDHNDVITTSDVLVYQETSNDDDVKNPILGSAIHEVVTVASHDDDDNCFIQGASPLQGTLLEGTDLATSSLRIDVAP